MTTTKAAELAILQAAADQLTADSYLGPWLRDAIPWLRDAMASDWIPESALRIQNQACIARLEASTEARQILAAARESADRILAAAKEEADRIMASAGNDAERVRGRAYQSLRLAMKELDS